MHRRTGLLPTYLSRIENGHSSSSIETLQRLVRALEIPLYQLFYDEEDSPRRETGARNSVLAKDWASHGNGAHLLAKLCRAFGRMAQSDRELIRWMAKKMARRKSPARHAPGHLRSKQSSSSNVKALLLVAYLLRPPTPSHLLRHI
jgi:transcriptional regulator with XRE-family HTH domain